MRAASPHRFQQPWPSKAGAGYQPAPPSRSLGPPNPVRRRPTLLSSSLGPPNPVRAAARTIFKQLWPFKSGAGCQPAQFSSSRGPLKPVRAASPPSFQAAVAFSNPCRLPASTAFKQPWPSHDPSKPVRPARFQATLALQSRCGQPAPLPRSLGPPNPVRAASRNAFKQPWPSEARVGCQPALF